MTETGVWADVVGQPAAIAELKAAVAATHADPGVPTAAMTHSWLFTGPPGSGRSTAAKAFAAALQCEFRGCGECAACHTVMSGTHPDVRLIAPEGLSISVKLIRDVTQLSVRRPATGRRQIVVIEDADRLSENAANALLKAVEEPPPFTVFLLCAPSTHPDDVSITIRSRCRTIGLRTPSVAAISEVLQRRDGIEAGMAGWAASVCAGHVGRARRLARDAESRERRERALALAGIRTIGPAFAEAQALSKGATEEAAAILAPRDASELEQLRTSYGVGGTGKGVAAATRGMAGAVKELEGRQKARHTRTQRDILDQALIELSGFYRDVIVRAGRADVPLTHPDRETDIADAATRLGATGGLRRLNAVLACREAIEVNVKPQIALEAMMTVLAGIGEPAAG